MTCHECDSVLARGDRYVLILFGAGDREVICLDCAISLDWLAHGMPVYVHGAECRTCGKPTCHDCSGLASRDQTVRLCARYNEVTAPYVPRTDHAHKRNAQLARAIKARLTRIVARVRETESGRLTAS